MVTAINKTAWYFPNHTYSSKSATQLQKTLNYFYTIPKQTISACETDCFSLRNGPFGVLKRTVLERQMACISNPLIINAVQRLNKTQNIMIYFYILLPVFSSLSRLIRNNVS